MKLKIISGPCVVEDEATMDQAAFFLKRYSEIYEEHVEVYFKSSVLKDNRSKSSNYKGPGFKDGMKLLLKLKEKYNLKITTDFHCKHQIEKYGHLVDIIQIPAFLGMQTSLIEEASKVCKKHNTILNVKKPQWMRAKEFVDSIFAKFDMDVDKIWLTERGTEFGYNNLVLDIRNVKEMSNSFYTIIDAGHLARVPGKSSDDPEGGRKDLIMNYALTGILNGADGIFLEIHPNPEKAKCDAATQVDFKVAEEIFEESRLLLRKREYGIKI